MAVCVRPDPFLTCVPMLGVQRWQALCSMGASIQEHRALMVDERKMEGQNVTTIGHYSACFQFGGMN